MQEIADGLEMKAAFFYKKPNLLLYLPGLYGYNKKMDFHYCSRREQQQIFGTKEEAERNVENTDFETANEQAVDGTAQDITDKESTAVQEGQAADGQVKSKSHKGVLIALIIILVLALGAAAAGFIFYYQDAEHQRAELAMQVSVLQKQNEELNGKLTELDELEEAVEAMAPAQETEKIPFAADPDDWKYVLVNERMPLSRDFVPQVEKTYDGQSVDRRIRASLEQMIDDAKEDGMQLMICSSYRDIKKQDSLVDKSIAKWMKKGMGYTEAFYKTKEQIALTGYSEHHTGLAVDIVGKSHQSLDAAQADTKEAKWLNEHAYEYGFVLRYPADKEKETMISFESWHYRYVGKEAAAYMKENNLCLEEFVALLQEQNKAQDDQQASAD